MTGYALHPEAFNDLDEIRAYVAEDNPDAADRMVTEIFDGSVPWFLSPIRATAVPISHRARFRFKLVREYVFAYAPEKKPLWVVAVPRTPQPRVIAAILRGRE